MKNSKLNEIIDYINYNLDCTNIELYEFLWNNYDNIIKKTSILIDDLEEILDSRSSDAYLELVDKLKMMKNKYIKIEEVIPYIYISLIDKIDINKKNKILNNIEVYFKKYNSPKKGFKYEDMIIDFLETQGINILERNKTNDGGLDIIGEKEVELLNDIKVRIFVYGQIKCHSNLITDSYLKILLKDYIYKTIVDNKILKECRQIIFISHLGFSKSAEAYAYKNNILLLTTEDIVRKLLKNKENIKVIEKYLEKKELL
ncbi:restriction endonuclease [Clostridium perfringens]|uniref:restriction endonuclease n=1 Tax=Clostridium perfringens TaxID=1502 RepID=UPI001CADB963|nr:restriction endonuclease [Clostridium perfringens]EJT5918386.1 restriction endonuclease [Clostridium perfringens]MDH5065384.1 hypothetical protein [Clostridium perfringens]MDM0808796.1 restriction endonuclease [Clostridium perfringens]MDM0840002.1 restriction endonuclease [Clostridium perfringens]UBL02918.1 restriction endonuclease [Clostridium perfringens]